MQDNNYWERFFDFKNIGYPIFFGVLFAIMYLTVGFFLKLVFDDIWFTFSSIVGFVIGNVIKMEKNN